MKENVNVVSFDPTKTWVTIENDKSIFCKKTNKKELKFLKYARKRLNNKTIDINSEIYTIYVPSIINYKNGILYLEYCNGNNLELILRNNNTHKNGVVILNTLLKYLIKNKIFWIDFAPRNIIIDKPNIFIVDFEKGFQNRLSSVNNYLLAHIIEEYYLFLLKNEREFFLENNIKYFNMKKVKIDRFQKILSLLFDSDRLTKKKYFDVLQVLLTVEEPFIYNNLIIYPGVILDDVLTKGDNKDIINIYASYIVKLYKLKNQSFTKYNEYILKLSNSYSYISMS